MRQAQYPAQAGRGLYFPALDGLRMVAFAMVFWLHMFLYLTPDAGAWGSPAINAGSYGVSLFFVLSSFLITTLLLEERRRTGTVHIGGFYVRRILRIWPLYFLMLGTCAVYSVFSRAPLPSLSSTFGFLTFTGNLQMSAGLWPSAPAAIFWSICVEEQFYLAWPWVARLLSSRSLAVLGGGLVVAGLTFRLFNVGQPAMLVWFHTLFHLDCFGFGCLAALVKERLRPISDRASYAIIASTFLAIYLIERGGHLRSLYSVETLEGMVSYTFVALACAVIVLLGSGLTSGIFVSRPATAVGKITFGLYCCNALMLHIAIYLAHGNPAAFVVLYVSLSFGFAYVAFRFYETPFLRLKSKLQLVRSGSII